MLEKYEELRNGILSDSTGQDQFIEEELVLNEVLESLLEAKLVDSEVYNDCYFNSDAKNIKINGYAINETQERLQIFIVDETSLDQAWTFEDTFVSEIATYTKQLSRALKFVKQCFDGSLLSTIQDSDPCKVLASQLNSKVGIEQFDVVEIFLISLTATVSRKGAEIKPRDVYVKDQQLKIKVPNTNQLKDILIKQNVIDLNFIENVMESRNSKAPLQIDFERDFNCRVEVLQAADEKTFKSYMCVFPGNLLYELYKHHSSRLLEKNVRSFLQFQGTNKGIRQTIRDEPEKFIAFNNGLTITATSAQINTHKKREYIDSLTDFQIVNGGQTTASIYFSKKEGLSVDKIRVMAKINVVTSDNVNDLDTLVSAISEYSNTQSRVSKVDLKSRSPELVKIKSLSNSMITPTGRKWFFELAKGDFRTILRKAGSQRKAKELQFPSSVRFTKEQLAKYYVAWGEQPYLVKKGGEKVFRDFLMSITPTENGEEVEINESFYEKLIAKIILFREMEKIYGQGKYAIGQIRSAAIPYSISALRGATKSTEAEFDLSRIWRNETLEEDLKEYLRHLLILMNDLIKKYAQSDDYGEYAKKAELWDVISECPELKVFFSSADSQIIQKKYTVPLKVIQ